MRDGWDILSNDMGVGQLVSGGLILAGMRPKEGVPSWDGADETQWADYFRLLSSVVPAQRYCWLYKKIDTSG